MPKTKNPQLLRDYLNNLTVDELRKLGGLLPNNMPIRKEERIESIHQSMMTGEGLKQLWARLDKLQKAAVSEVVHGRSDLFDAGMFRSKYGGDPDWGTKESSWIGSFKPSLLGLFFFNYRMPTDLKAALITIAEKPAGVQLNTLGGLPEQVPLTGHRWQLRQGAVPKLVDLTICETQRLAQHDLIAVLRLVEAGQVKVTAKNQRPTSATLLAVAGVLEGGDYYPLVTNETGQGSLDSDEPNLMRAFAWPLLVLSANLAEVAGAKLQLTEAGKKALTDPVHQTLRKIWSSWLKNKILDEFNRISNIKGQNGKGAGSMTAPAPRRQKIADTLADLPVNQWVAFDEFSRFMQASGRTFGISRDLRTLYVEDANYGSLGYSGFGEWHILQARYLLVFLMEYAATLGMIDIAYIPPAHARIDFGNLWGVDDIDHLSNYDGLRYLRLNNLGAWSLGLSKEYEPPVVQQEKVFNLLPNHDIVIMGKCPASDRLMISRLAEQTSERVWRLVPTKLLEAHEANLSLNEIRNYLSAKSNNELPQTVSRLLDELIEKSDRFRKMENAHLIEVSDQQIMQILVNDSRLAKFCLPAGERHIAIPTQSLSAFRRVAHELGYALPS